MSCRPHLRDIAYGNVSGSLVTNCVSGLIGNVPSFLTRTVYVPAAVALNVRFSGRTGAVAEASCVVPLKRNSCRLLLLGLPLQPLSDI